MKLDEKIWFFFILVHTESPIECCSTDGVNLTPRYVHPFCSPIYVTDDKKYAKEGVTCLNFVRSIPAIRSDCSFGASDQVNADRSTENTVNYIRNFSSDKSSDPLPWRFSDLRNNFEKIRRATHVHRR